MSSTPTALRRPASALRPLRTPLGVALATLLGLTLVLAATAPEARARGARGVKKLAMKRFDCGAREVKVLGTAKAPGKGGAALVRLQNSDVPVCQLLILDGPPRRAKSVVRAVRLPVCAAYDKEARQAKLDVVPFTSRVSAYRVSVFSKRMDAIAKGVEKRRFWGLYADMGTGVGAVFERTSTSFKSQVNKAINQSEVCEAPTFSVADKPTKLSVQCVSETMLGGAATRKRTTVNYTWSGTRFSLH